jgi:hypothetical protein
LLSGKGLGYENEKKILSEVGQIHHGAEKFIWERCFDNVVFSNITSGGGWLARPAKLNIHHHDSLVRGNNFGASQSKDAQLLKKTPIFGKITHAPLGKFAHAGV